ncbi:MAG: hypothetical protein JNM95_00940 [Chitinophagaceae bacterium]|nr:hypothetical protein [Chitinophagaceae bacterium]
MKRILLTTSIIALSFWVQAQRVKLLSGDPKPIQNETKINVLFTYENMSVGRFDKEAEYIASKKEEYNKKESGRGDKWEKSWVSDRKARFEPAFTDLFEKNTPFAIGNYPDSKYTMVINTSRTEPGYNIYISKKNAEIDLEVKIMETDSKKVICEYSVKRSPGRTFGGYDYDTGQRIEESYAAAGKHFGKDLKKDLK